MSFKGLVSLRVVRNGGVVHSSFLQLTFVISMMGCVWKDSSDGGFLSSPFCYMLTMNVDWFQPFERGVYSLGAIYLTVQNLPRTERYKPSNLILVGIIPGPSEPSCNINSYLTLLVLELQEAWNTGLTVLSPHGIPITIKLALSCVACDIPASRKVSGFLGHNATLGCNKCLKKFGIAVGEKSNFGGFDRQNWPIRTVFTHRQDVTKVTKETTKVGIQNAESKYGVRFSILLTLILFDSPS